MKHVLFIAAESAPYIKTGGLGSVIGSLPKALNKLNTKVSIVIPAYQCIDKTYWKEMERVMEFPVQLGWRVNYARIYALERDGVTCYLVSNDDYYKGKQPYGEMGQDIEKYAFFCKAVCELVLRMEDPVDILHCHDWQSALVPVYVKEMYQHYSRMRKVKTILTIHNLRFQGITDLSRMQDITGLPWEAFTSENLEHFGNANMVKGGIAYADVITAVSQNYAKEIMTQEYGERLSDILKDRAKDVYGIVNGIDTEVYDPERDLYVSYPYTVETQEKYHKKNKLSLQRICNLPMMENVFTMGIVSRLTDQKGYDLLGDALEDAFAKGAQLYVLGEGQEEVEDIFRSYQERYPKQVFWEKEYSDKIAKKIYAGCDVTLMPSKFEPCGLNQMMSLRYGCLPFVRATGGLKDTVEDQGMLDEKGDGFLFEEYTQEALKECFQRMYTMYEKYPKIWQERIKQGMQKDFSWKSSAQAYEKLYNTLR